MYLAPCITAFLICLVMTPIVRRIAIARRWVAKPRADRWHKKTTALFGGIAIYSGMFLPFLWVSDFRLLWSRLIAVDGFAGSSFSIAAVVLCGATFLFALGLADDFFSLKPQNKLIGQIIVASVVVYLGFRLNWFESMTLDAMVTLVWIVGITNAFNLLDNMDGLCAGIATIAALTLSALYMGLDPTALRVALIVAGSCGAFLVYNFNPASIFMGDCGSLIIGFTLAVLGLHYGNFSPQGHIGTISVPLLILMVPLLDTSLVTIIRLLSGRKASTGGRDHTSHRLVLMGFSEKGAVLFLYGVGAVSGLAAIVVHQSDSMTSPAVIIPVVLSMLLMGVYLAQLRVYPEKEFSVLRDRRFTPVLIELTHRRQIMMVILDFGLVAFSYYLAYRLRFDGADFVYYFNVFIKSLPIIIAAKLIVFYFSGIYSGFWQYISTRDIYFYVRGTILATILSITLVTFLFRFTDFSKGVFLIDWVLTTLFLLGTRGSFRLFTETIKRKTLSGDRVIIYGAGRGGELLLREILNNPSLHIKPVGFIDDDPLKLGKRVQGFPILGDFQKLSLLKEKHDISGLLLSFNGKTNAAACQSAAAFCRNKGLFLKKFVVQLESITE